jgi:hypothetical protein
MRVKIFCLVLLGLAMISGCTLKVLLYPVQGPLSTQTPSPVFPGKLSGMLNSGSVSFVLGDGEIFKGGWTRVIPVKATQGAAMVSSPQSEGMPAAWDTVYGSGFYVAHVLGARLYAQAAITGNRGTVLHLEFYNPSPGVAARLLGVAKDSKGNLYKLALSGV